MDFVPPFQLEVPARRGGGARFMSRGSESYSSASSSSGCFDPMRNQVPRQGDPAAHGQVPSIAGPSSTSSGDTNGTGTTEQSKPERPPRPMNAWLLFRTALVKQLQSSNPAERKAQGQMSKHIIAELWKSADAETRNHYEELAREKKEEHARLYPDYRYTPRDKPAKVSRRRASAPQNRAQQTDVAPPGQGSSSSSSSTAPATLAVPRRASTSTRSPRTTHAPPPNYHPYGARGPALARIDTSHATSTWQPHSTSTSNLASAGAYPHQNWTPSYAQPFTDERQPFRSAPVSAPPNFSGRSLHDQMLRQPTFEGRDEPSYQQYSPNWPTSASSTYSNPQPPALYAGSPAVEHSRQAEYPNANSLPPAEPVPTFEYSLYRAPTSYPSPMAPSPTDDQAVSPMTSYRPQPSRFTSYESQPQQYHPQFTFNHSQMFPPPPASPSSAPSYPENDFRGPDALLPEHETWRNERQKVPVSVSPVHESFDSHHLHSSEPVPHHQQRQHQALYSIPDHPETLPLPPSA
ncbi:uncharacterized protein JCM6883_005480 [Sporobolomyces salmoneus]|uniref:uncharacterized protein n=1 Tax=Sporobolomyces salmoneus TaxID=183962 RepID=UPI003179DB2B